MALLLMQLSRGELVDNALCRWLGMASSNIQSISRNELSFRTQFFDVLRLRFSNVVVKHTL